MAQGKYRQEGERPLAVWTAAAPDLKPVMLLTMDLFLSPPMANN
jgi:hypothetical protein